MLCLPPPSSPQSRPLHSPFRYRYQVFTVFLVVPLRAIRSVATRRLGTGHDDSEEEDGSDDGDDGPGGKGGNEKQQDAMSR